MNSEQENRFFNQIEKVLHDHNDAYEVGAWEEFDAHRSKSKHKWGIYRWLSAAVILLIASFGLFQFVKMKDVKNLPSVVVTKHKNSPHIFDAEPQGNTNLAIVISDGVNDVNDLKLKKSLTIIDKHLATLIPKDSVIKPTVELKFIALNENTSADQQVANIENIRPKNHAQSTREYAGAYDNLVNLKSAKQTVEKFNNKLTYSLVVSPSIGNEKINLGAGVGLSFALNPNISISSGLMYTALNASSSGKSFAKSSLSTAQGAHLSLSGIELPLGVQYQTKGGYYATAGVSAVGLIKNDLEYQVSEQKTVSFIDNSSGTATEVFTVVSELKTEKSTQSINNYLGFFNFSAGKKQAFGKVNLNVGPFVKIPFSSITSERIKLLQGGVKLSVDF